MIKNQNHSISTRITLSGDQIHLTLHGQTIAVPTPVRMHLGPVDKLTKWLGFGYEEVKEKGEMLIGTQNVSVEGGEIEFKDTYALADDEISLKRSITVLSSGENETAKAFLTDFSFFIPQSLKNLCWFAPGLWYLENEYVPYYSFGSKELLQEGILDYCYFREDRLSAPLFGLYDRDKHWSLVLLHSNPTGTTVSADDEVTPLVDSRLDFGSFGLEFGEPLRMGFWFPGSECDIAYPARDWSYSVIDNKHLSAAKISSGRQNRYGRDLTFPGILRFHPFERGFTHDYELHLKAFNSDSYPDMLKRSWRFAWETLKPAVKTAPLERIEQASIHLLGDLVREEKNATGIPFSIDIFSETVARPVFSIGFVGRNILSAYYLIRAGYDQGNPELIRKGEQIVDFWVNSAGPGNFHTRFNFYDGIWQDNGEEDGHLEVYLRPLAEGYLACIRAWAEEKKHGVEKSKWLQWAVGFGEWLLLHQNPDGSFYRMYFSDGKPAWKVSTDCYSVIPFLVTLEGFMRDQRYLEAAERVGKYIWENYQSQGHYIGGTIDNPSCYDKEAASISLEAYLTLYSRTGEKVWLEAAKQAADFAETWIYIWDIPLPLDSDERHWSKMANTIGLQLVCTGHSLSDMYLAFNCGEYAQLWQYTGDPHYLDVANILLHNTKQLIWFDNPKVDRDGFQQEHWTFSIGRGAGRHSNWLPWVSISHLVGMEKLSDLLEGDHQKNVLLGKS